ncbi:tRNA(Met) cytidine acetyltransferase [Halobacteriales archaeon QS_4_69_31]|nr:MAG: tRNA(Met) cytidine acetyltransferase [Halobacteriales archaeon QS_4_69_31]
MTAGRVAADLRAEAREADERRLLVLAGDGERTREAAERALDAAGVDPAGATYLGTAEGTPWERVEPRRAGDLLGTTRTAVVLDCHDACRPNAVGRAVGAVDGGGLLVFLTPPLDEWPDRRDGFDESLAVPPFDVSEVTGNFRERLVELLRAHPGIAIVSVGADAGADETVRDGLTHPAPRLPADPPTAPPDTAFPDAVYERCRTADQADAVAALEALREPGHALVVEADRGRGKSSAAGLAAGALALDGRDVLVTAPQYRNAAEVFARAREVLTDADALAGDPHTTESRHLETAAGRVRFERPADAVEALQEDPPDALVVDEAAALPVRVLADLLDAPSVAFATTVHGYEGAGRGFSVRFRDRLAESGLDVTDVELNTPIRYGPYDPVEAWAFRALLLDASPAVAPLVTDATPETVGYRRLDAAALLADEHLLREVFGLLVLAHYRTEPNDLARLLDAPNVSVRALTHEGHVVSVALLAREGDLPADLRAHMYDGGRVRGNMVPDVLTSQLRDEAAGRTVGQRVLRIATHHTARSRGLGSLLLDRVESEFGPGVDWLGTGFGATPALVRFWRENGFAAVHLSTTRNDASGEYSAVMLRPTSEAGRALADRHAEWFCRRVPGTLTDALRDADPDVVRETLAAVDATPRLDLSDAEWRLLAGLPSGASVFDTAPRPLGRLGFRYLVERPTLNGSGGTGGGDGGERADSSALTDRQERLLVRKALQAEPWPSVAAALDFHSTGECMRALGAATRPLLSRFAPPTVDLERFE